MSSHTTTRVLYATSTKDELACDDANSLKLFRIDPSSVHASTPSLILLSAAKRAADEIPSDERTSFTLQSTLMQLAVAEPMETVRIDRNSQMVLEETSRQKQIVVGDAECASVGSA
ncbi:hypothetical protein EIP86_005287 [Pleurotus ostreatoroseus]|nr:hypothetical protein EIP86_005287 [Pleurotus ostreatoroseus]